MKKIKITKQEIEELIADYLREKGIEKFTLFSHATGVTIYVESEEEDVLEEK